MKPAIGPLALTVFLVLVGGMAAVQAQSGSGYDLTWNSVDGGGVTFSSSGGYTLGGTAGQPDAATWSGGGYTLSGGFWGGGAGAEGPQQHTLYLPVVLKETP
jgi:hypothetical protein